MSDRHETIADIIAWLRRPREGENAYLTAWRDEIADRLEAAHRRERGDAAKLREALEKATERLIRIVGCDHYTFHRNNHHCDFKTTMGECRNKNICETIFKAQAALAAPPRNCDVGTAEEQTRRFADYCARHRHTDLPKCAGCPLEDLPSGTGCVEAWAQRPYEEGGAK